MLGLSDRADSLPAPTGERIEATQLIEHRAMNMDEAKGTGFLERAFEAPRRINEGFAAGREEVISVNVSR